MEKVKDSFLLPLILPLALAAFIWTFFVFLWGSPSRTAPAGLLAQETVTKIRAAK
jgi:hypothetical protein